ncbi:MAG: right-handed parallel beta-helix repeat-containing protein [Kiritimatiellia bacterium]
MHFRLISSISHTPALSGFSHYGFALSLFLFAILLCRAPADHYVAQNGQAPSGTFTSWDTAASNIQDAINVAYTNSTVWVGAGRYTLPANPVVYMGTNVVYISKPLVLRSSNGVPDTTIIDGGGKNRGVVMYNGGIGATNYVVIDGFTISNCAATNFGGGIIVVPGTWTGLVQNCVISSNSAVGGGGGIAVAQTYSHFYYIVSNCVFRGNRANYGGGMTTFIRDTAPGGLITHCLFETNLTTAYGAGLCVESGTLTIDANIFRGNRAATSGGGMHIRGGTNIARNCLYYNNSSTIAGGGIYYEGSYGHFLHNCTVVSNRGSSGSGIGFQAAAITLQICNSIVYSNLNGNVNNGLPSYTNSCTYPTNAYVLAGTGNITSPPAFVNFAGQDFRLSLNSPCLNTGTNLGWTLNAKDLDGKQRIRYGRVDMGAYELIYDGTIYRFH